MIRIVRSHDNKGLFVSLELGYPMPEKMELDFFRASASEVETRLLEQEVRKKLHGLFEEIRKVSYLKGWKDAKSKKARKSHVFPNRMYMDDWERKEAGL